MSTGSTSPAASRSGREINLLGTPLMVTTYDELLALLPEWAARPGPTAVEFCNTQIVTKRRLEKDFRETTARYDHFVPDGMPLIWCLRLMGASLRDRVYGPTFMRHALSHETKLRHYFLGGSEATSQKLVENARQLSGGQFQLVGANHQYWGAKDAPAIREEIKRLSPDVIWVGLGTPKQQQWVQENKALLSRGVILTVGFAFDVNAGTKADAPLWMQKLGLTWAFRISQEPSRLLGRYIKYNSWFLFFCLRDYLQFILSGGKRAKQPSP